VSCPAAAGKRPRRVNLPPKLSNVYSTTRKQSRDIDPIRRRAFTTRTNAFRRVDRRSPVRVCGHHHDCHRFDLRGLLWKSSGQSSFRDPASLFNSSSAARHDAQKSKGRAKRSDDDDDDEDDEDEDDSVGRLTSEEAWLFPVVRLFTFIVWGEY